MQIRLRPTLHQAVVLPTSKSLSARALIINALADKPCRLQGLSDCDDTNAVVRALGHNAPVTDIGAAGTAMRFLSAYYCAREGETHLLTGSERMKQRPIGILVDALRQIDADIDYEGTEGFPPLRIRGKRLTGGEIRLAADVSSQYISALLMIGPTLERGLTLHLEGEIASRPYILMTLQLMQQFGATTCFEGQTITVAPGGYHRTTPFSIEPDWSAASYWYELVALSPDPSATVTLQGLVSDSAQGDSICASLFRQFGVSTTFTADGAILKKCGINSEPVYINFSDSPDLAQTFVVTAALTGRRFRFEGLKSLKIKETDRIAALIAELKKLGIGITETAPGELSFEGRGAAANSLCEAAEQETCSAGRAAATAPVSIATYDDHRMAMAFAPAAYLFPGIVIEHPEVVSKSYPNFWIALPKC